MDIKLVRKLSLFNKHINHIFSKIPEWIVVSDKEYTIIYMNETAKRAYGNTVGKKCYSVFQCSNQPCYLKKMPCSHHAIFDKGKKSHLYLTKDSKGRWLEVQSISVQVDGEQLLVEIVRDITEKKNIDDQRKKNSENLEHIVTERTLKLKESMVQFETIFDLTPDPMIILDWKGKLLKISNKVEEITGFKKEDVQGKNFLQIPIITAKSKAILTKNLLKKMLGQHILPYEIEILSKDGIQFIFEVNATKIEYQKKSAVMVVLREVTHRRKTEEALRESEEMYRTLVKTSPDAVTVTDLNGKITYVSERALKLHQYSDPYELIGKSAFDFINPAFHEEAMRNLMKTVQLGFVENLEYSMVRKDGSEFIGELNAALISDASGKPKGFIATTRDVTERYKVMEMKDRFVAAATHELRTPLVSIKAYLELMQAGDLGSIPKQLRSGFEIVKRNTDLLIQLTEDLLDIRRLESDKLNLKLEPLIVQDIVDACVEDMLPLMKKKRHIFHLEMPEKPLFINADQIRISQVFLNLLSNAVKFTPHKGSIDVNVVEEENAVTIQISDSGIGIKEEDLERVFEPFSSIKKPSYVKGTGLGLSVSLGLINAQGGRLLAESKGEGKGATFTCTLPKLHNKASLEMLSPGDG